MTLSQLAIALFLVAAPSFAAAETPRHVRVVWEANPQNQAYVSWTTRSPARDSRVVWDSKSHGSVSAYDHAKEADLEGEYDGGDLHYHHALLTGLSPSTPVHFRVVNGKHETKNYWFMTAPADSRPFVFLYGGDSRSDSKARRRMNKRIRDLVEADPSVIALVHGGDYIMSGGSMSQWEEWLDDWEESITSDDRVLPIVPARGNHETKPLLFNRIFAYPGDALDEGDWYTIKMGEDFVLINLDSNVSQAGKQRTWLDKQLSNAQQYRWVVVNYHRPAYPAVKSPGGALYHWVPLFEQYNVNLVMESDGHVLKRTVPIRDGQMDPTGVVYVGEGGLGVPQRTPEPRWYLESPGMAMAANHVQAVRVTPQALYYSAILEDGTVADTYMIEPNRIGKYVAPGVAAMRLIAPNEIEVVFTRPVDATTAENTTNYTLEPKVPIKSVEYSPDQQIAKIRTQEPVQGLERAVVRSIGDITGSAIRPTTFAFPAGGAELPFEGKLENIGPGPEPITTRPIGPSPAPVPEQTRIRCGAITCSNAQTSADGLGYLLFAVLGLAVLRFRPKKK